MTAVDPHSYVFFNDFNSTDGTPTPINRSIVEQLCEDPRNINIVSSVLYMTCIVHALAANLSDLDEHTPSGIQRSFL